MNREPDTSRKGVSISLGPECGIRGRHIIGGETGNTQPVHESWDWYPVMKSLVCPPAICGEGNC